ncbi:alpha/beta fold hydrolase [Amycolatopsis sp. EV170708-02-1]|uniref:alpha/beta fold hydrolase n=1 Tax=Amycolatopsis sp. EV170708-02-1 TaxID=2919322 RepID=UPI001F0B7425|nr:alpha/beta hydrolase [Amycolatopsis sp. EV170708-02-1]UMP00008.1 alpha/beta hydrolase [Amycolatopsis sp. EV170708-02-1]
MTSVRHSLGEGRTIELPGESLHVYETGPPDGPPVVLLHGYLTSALTWRDIHPVLAETHRVIAVDLPGCGRSPAPSRSDWTAGRAADLIAGLFDALGLSTAAVVGSQMGGSLAAWFATRHPRRVSRLVVMAAGALGESSANLTLYRALATPGLGSLLARLFPYRAFTRLWAAAHGPDHRLDPGPTRIYHEQFRRHGQAMTRFGLGVRLSYGASYDALARPLTALGIPTLLLFGDADRLVPPSTGERFASLIPGSRLILLPGCGDFPQEEAPVVVAATIKEFLTEPE